MTGWRKPVIAICVAASSPSSGAELCRPVCGSIHCRGFFQRTRTIQSGSAFHISRHSAQRRLRRRRRRLVRSFRRGVQTTVSEAMEKQEEKQRQQQKQQKQGEDDAKFEEMTIRRLYAMSDVHADYKENLKWIHSLAENGDRYMYDGIIVSGDVSDRMEVLREVLTLLSSSFRVVFFTPGNHELWVRRERVEEDDIPINSVQKLQWLLGLCDELGVQTRPTLLRLSASLPNEIPSSNVNSVWVAPVLSWYHSSFDTEPDIPNITLPSPRNVMTDFRLCIWPDGWDPDQDGDEAVARNMDHWNDHWSQWSQFIQKLNHGTEEETTADILSFSHFLPRLELCPEKRMLFYPNLPKAVGSRFLQQRIQRLSAPQEHIDTTHTQQQQRKRRQHLHVFGHTHFGWDQTIQGIRYIQAAVAYPREWQDRPNSLRIGPDVLGNSFHGHGGSLLCLLDAETGCLSDQTTATTKQVVDDVFAPEMSASWSDHYKSTERDPDNTDLAPWVKNYMGIE